MINGQVKLFTLNSIFQMMENGSISSPSFQRGFVWTPESVKSLFDSINKGYPIGIVLAVEGESNQFERSPSEKSYFPDPELKGFDTWNTLWILDGTQRLAALYSVLKGKRKTIELFYDLDERAFFIDKAASEQTKLLPMSSLFDATDFRHFQTNLAQQENTEKLIDELHDIHRRFMNYAIPFQIITDVSNVETVEIFKRLNISGVSLTREDIENAKGFRKHNENTDVNNLQTRIELAKLYRRQNKLVEAESMFLESLQFEPHQVESRIELARIYQRQGKFDEAEEMLRESLQLAPHTLQSCMELAKLYRRQSRYDEAESVLLKSLEIAPHEVEPRAELAKIYQQLNRLDEAEKTLQESLQIAPRDLQLHSELARIYQRQGKFDEAEEMLRESLQLAPRQLFTRAELAKIYQQQNRLDEAEKMLLDNLEIDPRQLQPRIELADIYRQQDKLDKAEKMLLESLQLAPNQLYPRIELAKIYQQQGKLDDAKRVLEEVLKIDPSNDHVISELFSFWGK